VQSLQAFLSLDEGVEAGDEIVEDLLNVLSQVLYSADVFVDISPCLLEPLSQIFVGPVQLVKLTLNRGLKPIEVFGSLAGCREAWLAADLVNRVGSLVHRFVFDVLGALLRFFLPHIEHLLEVHAPHLPDLVLSLVGWPLQTGLV